MYQGPRRDVVLMPISICMSPKTAKTLTLVLALALAVVARLGAYQEAGGAPRSAEPDAGFGGNTNHHAGFGAAGTDCSA